MDSKTRAALVDKAELADRIAALITLRTQWSPIDRALDIIDTVQAAAVREPDDALVDKVAAALANHAAEEGENWYVDDDGTEHFPKWEDLPDDDTYLGGGEWPNPGRNRFRKQARAALAAAVLDAVAKAKEQDDEDSR